MNPNLLRRSILAASEESDAALSAKVSNIQNLSQIEKAALFCGGYEVAPATRKPFRDERQ
jgi:hypothetical protein